MQTRSSGSTGHTDRTDATSISSVASSPVFRLSLRPRSFYDTNSGYEGFHSFTDKNASRSSLGMLSIDESQGANPELTAYLDEEFYDD